MDRAFVDDLLNQDFSDFGRLLQSIGGWTIGCINHIENTSAVDRAKAEGLIQTRIHRAPIDPRGWECFELTDAGIEKVRALKGDEAAIAAKNMRQSYRNNAAKYAA